MNLDPELDEQLCHWFHVAGKCLGGRVTFLLRLSSSSECQAGFIYVAHLKQQKLTHCGFQANSFTFPGLQQNPVSKHKPHMAKQHG